MKKILNRFVALALCVLMLIGILPTTAFAAGNNVTIDSEGNAAFDYLQYYSSGKWKDLNTPRHWIESTGEVCYCIEHSEGNPHGDSYTAASPSSVFSSSTLKGLQIILMNGYPCNTPEGFTEDEARQATANAIRFWLSENGEEGSYNFTNRKKNPDKIRAKSGYEHVLAWADELLQKARDKEVFEHSITFEPTALTLTRSGDNFSGSTRVKLKNINSGYTLDTSELPSGVTVEGYTGQNNDTLTFTAPRSASGKTFTISAAGRDTRSVDNITAYVPSNGSLQKIFLCATTVQVVATAGIGVNTPAYGALEIKKSGTGGNALSGVKFEVFTDVACTNKLATMTTGSDGLSLNDDLPVGTVYVKELSTVSPYVIDSAVHEVAIEANRTTKLELENIEAKGRICIQKNAEQLTGTVQQDTDFGMVNAPKYTVAGLAGCTFEVYNAANEKVATLVTNGNGYAETELLAFGTYTVKETATVDGYIRNEEDFSVTLAYKNQNTPIVDEELTVVNERVETSVRMKKVSEEFSTADMKFHECAGAGYVFGLFTAEDIGVLPKDTLVEVLTTGNDGLASTIGDLPFGRYYLRELSVPVDTVQISTEAYSLTLTGHNTAYVDEPIVNDMFKGNIAVWKIDDSSSEEIMLQGAVYEIRDTAGTLYDTMVTDKDGYAVSIDLPVGRYKVQEVEPPAGYILSDEVLNATISTDNKATVVFEQSNTPNRMVLKKSDLTDGRLVPNCFVTIYDSDNRIFFEGETDLNGEIILGLVPAGTYTYKETQAPNGYAISGETFTFTMDDKGQVSGSLEIKDEPIVLKLTKMNTHTHAPFAGVEFTLFGTDGLAVKTVMTEDGYRIPSAEGSDTFCVDENGYAEFRYLSAGDYTLEEKTPVGYISSDKVSFTLSDKDSLTDPYLLTVENCPTGLKIRKIDASTNNALTGAGFRIKVKTDDGFTALGFTHQQDGSYFYDENGTVFDLMVDTTGEITILGLPLGTVWIEESVTPDGYFPISSQKLEITKDMTSEDPHELTIKNSKYVKLGMDSDWWEFPALIIGILLVVGIGVFVFVRSRKRRRG